MQSGIGAENDLRRFGIPVVVHFSGVGRNRQDHAGFSCVWDVGGTPLPHGNPAEATIAWRSTAGLAIPDLFVCQLGVPFAGSGAAQSRRCPPSASTNPSLPAA